MGVFAGCWHSSWFSLRLDRNKPRHQGLHEDRCSSVRLGAWVGNQRSRAATLTPERIERLSVIGMRWS
ncbi:helicase associated domain-containing protein [Streptomyces sp. NPDC057580]|uniref:helicase associated domain-containing protein n=1 Tax=Streptomyces sp. NPDC057580 TaxID=3346173 RepID=UPI0036C8D140